MEHNRFVELLCEVINEEPASSLLSIPGIYELLAEEFNNEVISRDNHEN